jgi:3-isopropylmalate/(R)-2-methylmalate dehydratase small subunit
MDSKRTVISGRAIVVRGNDIDTDRIIPARFLKTVTFDGLGEHAFEDDRLGLKSEGKIHAFDEPKFGEAEVLIVNKNFGCGSSREHAPQAIARWGKGIKVILGESFAEIFYGNCQSLGVPCPTLDVTSTEKLMALVEQNPALELRVDLTERKVWAGTESVSFQMPDGPRQAFLEGTWDPTFELLQGKAEIEATAARLPYINGYA